MTVAPITRLIVVEDDFGGVRSLLRRHQELQAELRTSGRGALPPMDAWSPGDTRELLRSGPGWDGTELLLVDCWDRDAVDGPANSFGSTFFALDLLAALRDVAEAADKAKRPRPPLPRVVAYSRAMADEIVRAALSEFMHRRVEVRVTASGEVLRGMRLDLAPDGADDGGVLWAMFERAELEDRLHAICLGDLAGSLAPPPPTSVVWDEFLPNSCLATFHNELRARQPDLWASHVVGPERKGPIPEGVRKDVGRIGRRFLEGNPVRGNPSWAGYLEIARRLADPS